MVEKFQLKSKHSEEIDNNFELLLSMDTTEQQLRNT